MNRYLGRLPAICLLLQLLMVPSIMAAPVVGGFVDFGYVERSAPVLAGPGVTITGGVSYGDGSLRYAVVSPQGTETLALTSDPNPTALGAISLGADGFSVYLGQGGGERIPIGVIDSVENGQSGQPLKINITFERTFPNPGFEDGLSGWTATSTLWPNQNSLNGLEIPIRPGLSCGFTSGLIRIATSPTSTQFSVTQVNNPPNGVRQGSYAIRLFNSGRVPSASGATCRSSAYSIFGPSIISTPFNAYAGDVFSVDWEAQQGGDWYDVFGFLHYAGPDGVWGTGNETRTVMFSERGDVTAWRTAQTSIPTDGVYRFEFVSGSYDRTGGTALGATLFVDNLQLVTGNIIGVTDADMQRIARQVTYQNSSCDPPASQNVSLTVVNHDQTGATVNANVNITLVNCPPALAATPIHPTYLEGAAAVLLFQGASVSTPEAAEALSGFRFTVNGVLDGALESVLFDGSPISLVNGYSGTTAGNGLPVAVSVAAGLAEVTVQMPAGMAPASLSAVVNAMAYQNTGTGPTPGLRTVTLTWLSDNGGTGNGGLDTQALSIASTVQVYALPGIFTRAQTNVQPTSATLVGELTDTGGLAVSERGLVYGTSPGPTIASFPGGARYPLGTGVGVFTQNVSGLDTYTLYHVRAYVITPLGVFYGEEVAFRPLVILCPDPVTVQCTGQVPPPNPAAVIVLVVQDPPLVVTHLSDQMIGGTAPCDYTIERTYRTEDSGGNVYTCTQLITVRDTLAPVVAPPTNRTVEYGNSTLPAATGTATATDNCSGSRSVTYSDVVVTSDTTCNLGPQVVRIITRTWSASDVCGNTGTAVQVITVKDTILPVFTINPSVYALACGSSLVPIPFNAPSPESTTKIALVNDGRAPIPQYTTDPLAPNPKLMYADTVTPGACAGNYTITRVWTATDQGCNTRTLTQTITVTDTSRPTVTAPPVADVPYGASTDPVSTGVASAVDVCDTTLLITHADVTNTLACAWNMDIVRTWTAADDCGNTHTANQLIRVRDTLPPSVAAPGDLTISCDASILPSSTGNATALDTEDPAPLVTYADDVNAAACPVRSVITRRWSALDACGNASVATQIITRVDTTAPFLTVPPDAVVELGSSTDPSATGTATAADGCDSSPRLSYTDAPGVAGACPEIAVLLRTWTAVDACANASAAVQVIRVRDTTAPVVDWPPDLTTGVGASVTPSATGMPYASDASGTVAMSSTDTMLPDPSCPGSWILNRTWTVTDGCNAVQHTQVISLSAAGGDAATITLHPQDQTVALGAPATFTASALGCGLGYQWTRNGVWIPGATSPSYTLPAAQAPDSGAQFACRVRTAVTIQTRSAMLIVSPPGPVPVLAAPATLHVETSPDAPDMLVFRFATEAGFLYRLQARPALGGEWLNLAEEYSGDGGLAEILLPIADIPSSVFRLLVLPDVETAATP